MSDRPIGFFVHHQGRGHAKRCKAILEHLPDRPITILSASRSHFGDLDDRISFVRLPDMIGDPSLTPALHDQETPEAFHCVPMGSTRLRQNAGLIGQFLSEADPSLFFVDVSAEWALLSRLYSVPAVKVRMHGQRSDTGHLSAYQACAGLVAPYDEVMEQDDYPGWAREKTLYSGGLCTTGADLPSRAVARQRLGISDSEHMVLVMSGGGGAGAPYAPLTMGARALPYTQWYTIGPIHREGHETDFANLHILEWVDNPLDYLAAADVVIASAGDNTVHEIARVGRPYLCIPEWRYFDEQTCKANALAKLNAAHVRKTWPASDADWCAAIAGAERVDLEMQRSLFDPEAARKIADYLIMLEHQLWDGAAEARDRRLSLVS